ncbi:hypothetical protein L6258_00660 [Candidatus Parcubacteria bacterium]|nr:hypothetical protein [Candidatus Parcubacteria bacterium]
MRGKLKEKIREAWQVILVVAAVVAWVYVMFGRIEYGDFRETVKVDLPEMGEAIPEDPSLVTAWLAAPWQFEEKPPEFFQKNLNTIVGCAWFSRPRGSKVEVYLLGEGQAGALFAAVRNFHPEQLFVRVTEAFLKDSHLTMIGRTNWFGVCATGVAMLWMEALVVAVLWPQKKPE